MAYQRVERQPLILIAIVTVLAGVLFYFFGPYGVVGAGVLGICVTFGIGRDDSDTLPIMDPEEVELAREQVGLQSKHIPRSWVPKALEAVYSVILIVLGVILATEL